MKSCPSMSGYEEIIMIQCHRQYTFGNPRRLRRRVLRRAEGFSTTRNILQSTEYKFKTLFNPSYTSPASSAPEGVTEASRVMGRKMPSLIFASFSAGVGCALGLLELWRVRDGGEASTFTKDFLGTHSAFRRSCMKPLQKLIKAWNKRTSAQRM